MRRWLLPDLGGGGSSRISAMVKGSSPLGRPDDRPGKQIEGSPVEPACDSFVSFSLVNFRRFFFAG